MEYSTEGYLSVCSATCPRGTSYPSALTTTTNGQNVDARGQGHLLAEGQMKRAVVAILLSFNATMAHAAPIGRWFSDWGQGKQAYTIQNDSAGSDTFSFVDTSQGFEHGGVRLSISVGGVNPRPGSTVVVTIGADEFEFTADKNGEVPTNCHICAASFDALWAAVRRGTVMRVRLAGGRSTAFTLAGAAKVLPAKPLVADFYW
jgi:hypothetical protein